MQMYKTVNDFTSVGVMPVLESIVTAVPVFFPVLLFALLLFGTGASYFAVFKLTGRKRFWNCITAMSFVIFIASLIIASMNTTTITFLDGYWVGFYILAVLLSWYGLANYK